METQNTAQDSINEAQAAQWLGVSIEALHELLDKHVFTTGAPRPQEIYFTHADLLMLSVWCESPRVASGKVLSMPNRRR